MTTIAIDTNVILDYWLERSPSRSHRALFLRAGRDETQLYIALPVLLECEWVLRSYYHKQKSTVIALLDALLELPSPVPDETALWKAALELYKEKAGISFDDCVILVMVQAAGIDQLETNDRKLAALFRRLFS